MFLDQLEKEIEQYQLLTTGEKILIGVSGGPDSIALLHGLHQLSEKNKWSLFVVHVNHQLRGEESERDACYVQDCCRKWGIPCQVEKVDVQGVLQTEGGNRQAIARTLRYDAFRRTAKRWQLKKLALAHHADDQVETILMRFLRGTGVTGLAGMERLREWDGIQLIRPMLSISRQAIESYCEEEELSPRLDQSNFSLDYTRNRIRLQLLPILTSYNSQVKEAILQLSEMIREEENVWEELVQQAMSQVVKEKNDWSYTMEVSSFLHLPVALQRRIGKLILNCLLKQGNHEVTLESVEQLRKLAAHSSPSASIHLPGNLKAERNYHLLRLSLPHAESKQKPPQAPPPSVHLAVPGTTLLPGFMGRIEAIVSDRPIPMQQKSSDWAVFDADRLHAPIMVRSRKPGDRMTCFGLDGTKKIKNVLMEAKIPRQARDHYPLVTAEEEIIWVPGVRRSKLALVTPDTRRYLYLLWYA